MTSTAPIGFLDAAYEEGAAGVACVLADTWEADQWLATAQKRLPLVPAPYHPGELYKRELPVLLSLLAELNPLPRIFVIDGYVWLGDQVPGLGAHLYTEYGCRIPVIGVAKSRYHGDTWSAPVLRGTSQRPLHVTAAGVELPQAAAWIRSMHGSHRLPAFVRLADQLSRAALIAAA